MDMERLAEIFEAVKVMPLRSTDIVVFRAPVSLDAEAAAAIYAHLEEQLCHSRIMILTDGADLQVVRPEASPAAEPEPAPAPQPMHRPVAGPAVPIPRSTGEKQGRAPGAVS